MGGRREIGGRRWEVGVEGVDMGEDVSMRVLYQIWLIRCIIAEAINH